MAKRKRTKIYKKIHRKVKIKQQYHIIERVGTYVNQIQIIVDSSLK